MKRNRILLLVVLGVLSLSCYIYMNLHYDILARNTSVNSSNRTLLLEKLNNEQIRYIVENNVDVNIFYKYLEDDLFVFDNYRLYPKAMSVRPSDVHTVVTFVNAVCDTMEFDDILEALQYYDYTTLRKMVVDHSPYNNQATIILNPDDVRVELGISTTIGEYEPTDLVKLERYDKIESVNDEIQLRKEAADALNNLCAYMEDSFGTVCGGMVVTEGYLSYGEIQQHYLEAISDSGAPEAFEMWGWPSHNEHQLGLSLDIAFVSDNLIEYIEHSTEYNQLRSVAREFGFVFHTDADFNHLESPYHMRYVGTSN